VERKTGYVIIGKLRARTAAEASQRRPQAKAHNRL